MAPIIPTQQTTATPTNTLSTPVIILIVVCAWILLVILLLIIRQCVVARGFCTECNLFGKPSETNDCCDCCIGLAQACDCAAPGVNSCCDSLCGPRKRCNIADCLACCNCGEDALPTDCCACKCPTCQPECNGIQCCCCFISCDSQPYPQSQSGYSDYPYPGYQPNQPYPTGSSQYPIPQTSQPYSQQPQGYTPRGSTSQRYTPRSPTGVSSDRGYTPRGVTNPAYSPRRTINQGYFPRVTEVPQVGFASQQPQTYTARSPTVSYPNKSQRTASSTSRPV